MEDLEIFFTGDLNLEKGLKSKGGVGTPKDTLLNNYVIMSFNVMLYKYEDSMNIEHNVFSS